MKRIYKKIENFYNKFIANKYCPYIIIFICSFILVMPYLLGKFHLGDDAVFHVYSYMSYAENLPLSIFYKILPGLGYNLGYGVGLFYPPLSHIVGAVVYKFVSLIGHGAFATIFIVHFMTYFFSGLFMYWLAQKIFNGHKKKALIASLFYITYNYFFVDLVTRDAIGEAFMFIFMPLVVLGLWYLFNEKNKKMFYICFVGGYVGLLYSHLVMSVYFTMFLVIVLLFYIKDIFTKDNFKALLFASILILILTSTFTVPMLEHKILGDYVVFDEISWTKITDVWNMPFEGFFLGYFYGSVSNGLIYCHLSSIVLIFFVLTLIQLIKGKIPQPRRKLLMGMVIFAILGIILNSFPALWLHVPSILLSIQFTWRLAIFVGFGFAIVAAEGLGSYLELFKSEFKNLAFVIILIITLILSLNNYSYVKDTTNIAGMFNDLYNYPAVREHYPTVIYKKYLDYISKRDDNEIIVNSKNAEAKVLKNKVPYLKFEINNIDGEAEIQLPRIYYFGYTITDSNKNKLNYKEDKYGFITLTVTTDGVYEMNYTGTLGYKIASIVKYTTILGVIVYVFYIKKKTSIVTKSKRD